jgi:hypothetical protein
MNKDTKKLQKAKQQTLGIDKKKKDVDKKEELKKFKSKVSETVTIAGFLSITKKLVAQVDRIVSAIKGTKEQQDMDRDIRQAEIRAIHELASAIKSLGEKIAELEK